MSQYVYVDVHILRHLKEELVWAMDKRFKVIILSNQQHPRCKKGATKN